jgi:hemerythrin
MPLINWSAALSVGVAEIDQQHLKLIAMINELNDAMKVGKGKDALGTIVKKLNDYTITHFKMEEDYFARFRYPDASVHKKEHAAFIKKAHEIKDDLDSGKLSLSIEVMDFLGNWWKNHIQVTDKKYSIFFNEHGLK